MIVPLKILFVFLCLCFGTVAVAQSTKEKKDSSEVFRKIEKYSSKRKFTRFIYKMVFRPITTQKVAPVKFLQIRKNNYSAHEGRIIRKINIITLDPFGNSDADTIQTQKTYLNKIGNAIHLKTKSMTIRNLLLIRKNQYLDSLLVKESERLVRTQRFVRSITTRLENVAQDSVDVTIRVLDSWSLIPDLNSSTSRSNFMLTERNFLGLGHTFINSYSKSLNSPQQGYEGRYTAPNIRNSYISANVNYKIDFEDNFTKTIAIERPFFSPYARWASGVNIGQILVKNEVLNQSQVLEFQNAKYNFQDYWAGHSFQIFKGNTEFSRATNFITSARYSIRNFVERPFVHSDSLNIYDTEKLYLISFGISSRKYTQDKYIFNFNIVEDVASGFVYNFTTGYQKKFNNYQFYGGARLSLGNYFKYGYLSGNLEYGTFLNHGKTVQSTSSLSMVYFTNIKKVGQWKIRQFIKPEIIIGTNRLNTNEDRLTLTGEEGITGFDNLTLFGTKRMLLSLQTQTYSPWRLLGFRLNPFLSYTGGLLANANSSLAQSKLYSQVALGVLISNDFLVFNAFQFSFSYYPNIPEGNAPFKSNSVSTNDFGLMDFIINKPQLVKYR